MVAPSTEAPRMTRPQPIPGSVHCASSSPRVQASLSANSAHLADERVRESMITWLIVKLETCIFLLLGPYNDAGKMMGRG